MKHLRGSVDCVREPSSVPVPAEDIDRESALEALRLVLEAEEFRSSQQLSAFLTFSVGRTLDGRGATLKAYTIATEVFRRGADFDPQIDPIVRVEATRLRRALERFYGGPGADLPLRIVLPRGVYAVVFTKNERPRRTPEAPPAAEAAAETGPAEPRIGTRFPPPRFAGFGREERRAGLFSAAAALVLAASIWAAMPDRTFRSDTAFFVGAPALAAEALVPAAVAVVAADGRDLEGVAEDLRDALAAVRGFEVSAGADAPRAEAANGFVVHLRSDGIRLIVRLVAARDGVILWSTSVPRDALEQGRDRVIGTVAEKIAGHEAVKRAKPRSAHSPWAAGGAS